MIKDGNWVANTVEVSKHRESRAPQRPLRFARGTQRLRRLDCEGRDPIDEEIAQMVHDIRNPLSTMALESRVLQERITAVPPSEMQRALARFEQNLMFVDRMLQDLVDMRSIDAGVLDVCCEHTELTPFIARVIERTVPARDHGRVFLEADIAVTAPIDQRKMDRVIANLLANALKFGPPESGIVVRIEGDHRTAMVSVIDCGAGVSDEEARFIFDKYRRTARARDKPGSGLGLYISKKIVEAHGGQIGVQCTPGKGCRFYFALPSQNS
jgi:signal transduction histidine kinase